MVKVSARGNNEEAAREIERLAKDWTVRQVKRARVKRAGTCTVTLFGVMPQVFELAPTER